MDKVILENVYTDKRTEYVCIDAIQKADGVVIVYGVDNWTTIPNTVIYSIDGVKPSIDWSGC